MRYCLLTGVHEALAALANDLIAAGSTGLGHKILGLLPELAGASAAWARVPASFELKLTATSVVALTRLAVVVNDFGEQLRDCSFSASDLRANCMNARNFQRIADATLQEFQATFNNK
jgi:hypothetical protein